MCAKGDQVVLELPDNIDTGKRNRTISADRCCVEVLKHLWEKGIDTRGHCCGHGECNPSIIIADGYKLKGGVLSELIDVPAVKIESLIKEVDNRPWDIMQWQLVKVN